jgi:hypothetical protein
MHPVVVVAGLFVVFTSVDVVRVFAVVVSVSLML